MLKLHAVSPSCFFIVSPHDGVENLLPICNNCTAHKCRFINVLIANYYAKQLFIFCFSIAFCQALCVG